MSVMVLFWLLLLRMMIVVDIDIVMNDRNHVNG